MYNLNFIMLMYLLMINIVGFLIMLIDKKKAEGNKYRIPEATILSIAYAGGALGIYAGMQKFRHKTKKKKFTIGVPIGIVFNLIIFGGFLIRFVK